MELARKLTFALCGLFKDCRQVPETGTGRYRALTMEVTSLKDIVRRFLSDQSGATAIEYALIAAGISIVIVTAVKGVGTSVSTSFTSVSTSLK